MKRPLKQNQAIQAQERPATKEEFMIEWVLKRAAFRVDFVGIEAAKVAAQVWDEIQRLK